MFPSTLNSEDGNLFDTTLLKRPARTWSFWSWRFHTQLWTKNKELPHSLAFKAEKESIRHRYFFHSEPQLLPALRIYDKRGVFLCVTFCIQRQRELYRPGIPPLKYTKSFSKLLGTQGVKTTARGKQPQQEEMHFWQTRETKSLFKNKSQTRSYMNTYLLQVALWKAKSDKYKHYTELQASLPKPQTRCVLQRKQHNIYNGRQSQINQLNFKTDLWSRNSKYNEQF